MQAGVDEEVVADAALQNKALQEGQPLRSEALVQRRGQIERILQAGIRRQGFQRLFPAVAPPVQQARQAEIFAGRRLDQVDLVVAQQADFLDAGLAEARGHQVERLQRLDRKSTRLNSSH